MRVLVVHNILWSHYKAALFSELARQCPPQSAFLVLQMAESESKYQQLGKAGAITHDYPYELLHEGPLHTLPLSKKIPGLLRAIRRFKPDVVNLSGYYDPAYWVVMMYCRLRGIALVLSNESSEKDGARAGVKERIKEYIIRQFDGFINFGSSSAQYALRLGAQPRQILTQHAAVVNEKVIRSVYSEAYAQREDLRQQQGLTQHQFVFVGRLAEEKNLPTLLNAFAWLKTNEPQARNWELLIVGDGPMRSQVENREGVRWMGGQPWDRIPAYLALADALILPSYFEPWGLVVNEAMVCGLPVLVSSQCGCVNDLVEEGKNGYTFDPCNQRELASLMQSFVQQSDADRTRMGQHSLHLIAPFNITRVAKEIWQGYQRILSAANS
ncbi:glycosyltransferase family 4 protein [Siphonobacter sp.]|uniref:glycosyltransferase family 4 protein n=1 Tax=Siphonobacter sp. TaxID=1869184 RepID=UPI003B3BD563